MTLMWGYDPSKCDGSECPGDCDLCAKADEPAGKENEMMKYIVTVNYTEFSFADGNTALTFAEMAKAGSVTPGTKVEIEVKDNEED